MKVASSFFFAFVAIAFVTGLAVGQTQGQSQTEDEKVYLSNEVDEKLLVKVKPKANYTDQARRNCIQGYVLLRGIFRPNGKIEKIEVVKGLDGGLTESAINAMKKIKFSPAKKAGVEVSALQTIEYNFTLIQRINGKLVTCK